MVLLRKILIVSTLVSLLGFNNISNAQETPPDYTSKVPKYTFSTTLEKQEGN